ncbi:MAG: Tol-Pal system beta propeller repeat protein TolB [Elusimicrobium sp.]|jgi:TolB protein|nr:Tol-Pal system beta propeller repeat protein TolB [Elusimicrobium sp.]
MKKFLYILLIFFPLALAAQTDVYIGIATKGGGERLSLGLAEIRPDGNSEKEARQIFDVMRADLMFSRHFDIKENGPWVNISSPAAQLDEWQKKGADFVVQGDMTGNNGEFELKIYVFYAKTKKVVFARAYKGKANALRRLAHIASDQIVFALTGKRGIADTRIAFSNSSTGNKEIYIADYDGANLRKLTSDKSIAILPRWSPDGKIYYTSYRYRNPDIFAIDLAAGKVIPVATSKVLNLIGGVSPDGKTLAVTRSGKDNPSLFEINLETKKSVQITESSGVDGSPSYSPDGKFITFVSNRSGNPQIYVMEMETGSTRRLTSSLNWADTPQWSPTGEWIVFAGRTSPYNPIDIFLIDITGTQVRQLTSDKASNEDPTWSPDGRFIAFTTTRNGRRQLYVMDADGSAPHLLADIPGNSYTPNWSK